MIRSSFLQENNEKSTPNVTENMHCRVVGSVRVNQDKRSVMVFKITPVENTLEVDAHELEVVHARLKIRQYKEKENANIGANPTGGASSAAGLSNSMMGGFATSTGCLDLLSS